VSGVRLALALALGASLLSCGFSIFPKCQLTEGGACGGDDDCVLAHCADADCGGCGSAGCGTAVAKSRIGVDHRCLVAAGTATPAGCEPTGPRCGCAIGPCDGVRARCVSGACVTERP
jgi:hypothetical protein